MPGREKDPRVAVFCRCGAVWFGRHTIENQVIEDHQTRLGCGPAITADEFEQGTYGQARKIKWPAGWTQDEIDKVRGAQ